MNMTSSRSHSIFTLHLSYQRPGSDTTTRAKVKQPCHSGSEAGCPADHQCPGLLLTPSPLPLNSLPRLHLQLNLVDLAGSERASRSNAVGQHLEEAKHINLSLHYLEAVIIALQQVRQLTKRNTQNTPL